MNNVINFFSEETDFTLENSDNFIKWIQKTVESYDSKIALINYIFCSDEYLHRINVAHLDHDTYTDIITFQYNESNEALESDIYISVDRVRENAAEFEVEEAQELRRVMIHGVLHLLGLGDKTEDEKKEMRNKEDYFLSLFKEN